jgi:hypothetical protein
MTTSGRNFDNLQIRAQNGNWYESIELFGRDRTPGDIPADITQIIFEQRDNAVLVEPFLKLTREAAQTLLDDLWHCGLRPSDGTGSVGQLQATEKHLEDMRRIAFQFIGTQEKKSGDL